MKSQPYLTPPPREVPLGVRLHILDHHWISGSLWFTMPAAAILLFGAIAQLPREARTAVVVFAVSLLLVAVWMGLPPLRRALRRVHRLGAGLVTMGRIVSCRYEGQPESRAKPYAEFMRRYGALAGARMLSLGPGCAIALVILPVAAITGLMVLTFVITAIARLFIPGLDAGDMDFDNLLRFCLAFIAFLAILVALRAIWRSASVPLVEAYIRHEVRQEMAAADEYHRRQMQKALDDAAKVGLEFPLPERSDSGFPIRCQVEYVALGVPRMATGTAVLGNHLDLAGVEPILFDPLNPGEVELFGGFSSRITVKNGQWQPTGWLGSATSLALAAGVLVLDAVLLVDAVVALVR